MKFVKGTFMRAMANRNNVEQEARIYEGVFAVYKMPCADSENWCLDHAPTGLTITRACRRKDCIAKIEALLPLLDWNADSPEVLTKRADCNGNFRSAYLAAINTVAS